MNVAVVGAIVAVMTFLLGVPATLLIVRSWILSPVREQLAAMTRERDYERNRKDELEDYIRNTLGRQLP